MAMATTTTTTHFLFRGCRPCAVRRSFAMAAGLGPMQQRQQQQQQQQQDVNSSTNRSRTSRRKVMQMLLGSAAIVASSTAAAAATSSPAFAESATAASTQEQQYTVAASGLEYCDTLVGSGAPIAKGSLIKAHYTGKLVNGTVFDSSYNRGKPLTFKVGVGEVIKGWDQGILGGDDIPPMLPGGKRKLRIPPNLGYGERGAGCRGGSCVIPPNSVLLFDVELIGKA